MQEEATRRPCGAELRHAHDVTVCDLPAGHDEQHGAWCDLCLEYGYDDPSDRLEWDRDGEDWVTPEQPARQAPFDRTSPPKP